MTILIGALAFIFLSEALLLYRDYYIRRKFKRLAETKFKKIEPLWLRVVANEPIDEAEVLVVAQDPSLRCGLFKMLDVYNKSELFPLRYLTLEKGAEGHLVNWLEFPTELGRAPDEIEFIRKVTMAYEAIDYYVFRYRSQLPLWAKQLDWMIGVSGPYGENSEPYDIPVRVFSRFNPAGSVSPETEVAWVHKHINP